MGAEELYVAAVEALRKNERQGETQFIIEIDGFLSSPPPPPLNVNVFIFCRFFFNVTLFMTKPSDLMLFIYLFYK